LVAALAYAGMIAAFLLFNNPVNEALSDWSESTLPADWTEYRLRWEVGHALSALLATIGLATLVRAWLAVRGKRPSSEGHANAV
jgi:hypothetical protein